MNNLKNNQDTLQAKETNSSPKKSYPFIGYPEYLKIKEKYPNSILLYQMNDFYEMFFEDATTAADILDIMLTTRNPAKYHDHIPMCGFQVKAATLYIAKLCRAGKQVAVCNEISTRKGTMQRKVVRVASLRLVSNNTQKIISFAKKNKPAIQSS